MFEPSLGYASQPDLVGNATPLGLKAGDPLPSDTVANSQRIATDKIAWAMGKLADLKRLESTDLDSRIFPATLRR